MIKAVVSIVVLSLVALGAQAANAVPPHYATYESPKYPESERLRETEGKVVVEITVSTSGDVDAVRVLESNPPGVFDETVIEAIKKSKFRPRCKQGFSKAFVLKTTAEFKRPRYLSADTGLRMETNIYGFTETLEPEKTSTGVRLTRVDLCGKAGE